MNSVQQTAVQLAALGISVIRVAPGQKRPLDSRWMPFTERARTVAEADRDFSSSCNIAIVTGRVSGLVGVDCDSANAERWALSHLPPSQMMVRTPSGGLHIYFRYPTAEDVRCAVKLRNLDIDVRGNRGYLLCPSSKTNDGVPYCWLHGPPTKETLLELPVFDVSWLGGRRKARRATKAFAVTTPARQRARNYIRHIVAESNHRGHDSTYRATHVLREFGLSAGEAFEELLLWNRTNAFPPWSESELIHKVESAYGVSPFES